MVGHDFGPRSREVEDVLIGLDATLGTLLAHFDRVVGPDRYVLALTADHGVAVIPEQNGAGRIANEDLGAVAEQALVAQWGPPADGAYVAASLGSQIYFANGVFDRLCASAAAMDAVEGALRQVPGVAQVVRRDRLDRDDPVTAAIARGYMEGRSGDLFVVPARDWIVEQRVDADATTHGTNYEYDRRVPLILMGPEFSAGPAPGAASPLDVAPTLAAATGIRMTNREGRALLRGGSEDPQPRTNGAVRRGSAARSPAGSAVAASGLPGTPR
jgi:arylsulfatase A-like enzyme